MSIFSTTACHVSAEHVTILQNFGLLLVAAVIISIATGKTYFRGVIDKNEDPSGFWISVISVAILALFILGALYACPRA